MAAIPVEIPKYIYPITREFTPLTSVGLVQTATKPQETKKASDKARGIAKLISIGTTKSPIVLDVASLEKTEGLQVLQRFEEEVLIELKSGRNKIQSESGRYYLSKETFEGLLQRAKGASDNNGQREIIPKIMQYKKFP